MMLHFGIDQGGRPLAERLLATEAGSASRLIGIARRPKAVVLHAARTSV
jgi:hypothetical protein